MPRSPPPSSACGCGTARAPRAFAVSATSGMRANGMPNESTTWLSTRASVGSTPIAEDDERGDQRDEPARDQRHADVQQAVHDLGARVGADRGRGEAAGEQADREEGRDEGSECRRGAPRTRPRASRCPGRPARFAAASSRMQRFTVPAMSIAIETSHRVARRSRVVVMPRSCARSGRGAASDRAGGASGRRSSRGRRLGRSGGSWAASLRGGANAAAIRLGANRSRASAECA